MYSTCLFCHSALGNNDVIERFPVGRRLAFDAARGRLWVVCRKCERWNLTPVEERWEAIEECERLFRDTTLRVSTDQIGLARVREGLELVRIGTPQRPEMAAWRYGDQFGRRRRRNITLAIAGGVAVGGVFVVGPLFGGAVLGGAPLYNLVPNLYNLYRARVIRARITLPGSESPVIVRGSHLAKATIEPTAAGWALRLLYQAPKRSRDGRTGYPTGPNLAPPCPRDGALLTARSIGGGSFAEAMLVGDDAIRAAGQLLPAVNSAGASKETVARAVSFLERTPDPAALFAGAASDAVRAEGRVLMKKSRSAGLLRKLPVETRLALEMAAHEDTERRALEGELILLENAWKDAEEIAAIADNMF